MGAFEKELIFTLLRWQLSKLFLLPSERVYSKKKEFAPWEQIFPFRVDPFSEGSWWTETEK